MRLPEPAVERLPSVSLPVSGPPLPTPIVLRPPGSSSPLTDLPMTESMGKQSVVEAWMSRDGSTDMSTSRPVFEAGLTSQPVVLQPSSL